MSFESKSFSLFDEVFIGTLAEAVTMITTILNYEIKKGQQFDVFKQFVPKKQMAG